MDGQRGKHRRPAFAGAENAGLFLRLTGHHRPVDLKAARLGNHFMEAEDLIQHVRIGQEGVSDDAQFAAAVQMTNGAANQRLRGLQAGL